MKKAAVLFILLFFCSSIVFCQTPTAPPEITPHPDGYTLHFSTDGVDYPVDINYWGDLSGRDTMPFSLFSDLPFSVYMEPGMVDIKEDFTSGYYLWIWDNHSYFGTNSSVWGEPVESFYYTVYTTNPETDMKLKFANYQDPVVLPTPFPTPMGTSAPTPPPTQVTFADFETGERIPDSDITVNLINYETFTIIQTWNSSRIIFVDDYAVRKLLQVTAAGYHEFIVFSATIPRSEPATVYLYKESYTTPVPVDTSTPIVLLKATPTPGPNTEPAWYNLVDLLPPEIDFSFGETAQAEVEFSYHHTGFRVIDWGIPEIDGNTITIDSEIIEWDGAAALWSTYLHHAYDLGPLSQGTEYTLVFKEWGKIIDEVRFTVTSPRVPETPEPPWEVYLNPILGMEQVKKGNILYALLTASLFENRTIAHTIQDWGEVTKNGSVFTVTPVFYRNTSAESTNALHYYSCMYDLGELDVGRYIFRVVSRGTEIYRQEFDVAVTFAPLPTIRPLPTTAPEPVPVARTGKSAGTITYPETTCEVTVKNYGAPCLVQTHHFLTDPAISIIPAEVSLGLLEEAVFTVTVNWARMSKGVSTSYNGFVITDSGNFREYLPWDIVLDYSGPEPTPTHPAGTGDVWFVPEDSTVNQGDSFTVEIHLDSGDQALAAYGFEISYTPSIILADLTIGNEGVEPGPDGFLSAMGAGPVPGKTRVQGFDTSGTGPGEDLHILTIHFTAEGKGLTSLNLEIESLADTDTYTIGNPNAIDGSVRVICSNPSGDVNDDGSMDIIDALLVAQYYVGLPLEGFLVDQGDVDLSGTIDIIDALLIAQYYVGLITGFPGCE